MNFFSIYICLLYLKTLIFSKLKENSINLILKINWKLKGLFAYWNHVMKVESTFKNFLTKKVFMFITINKLEVVIAQASFITLFLSIKIYNIFLNS